MVNNHNMITRSKNLPQISYPDSDNESSMDELDSDGNLKDFIENDIPSKKKNKFKNKHSMKYLRNELKDIGISLGFKIVESGPLVRSSYHAEKHLL